MKLALIWQGISGRYGQWKDGLWAAMQIIEQTHDVLYFDTTDIEELTAWNPDFVLYWEAPCTLNGKDAHNYQSVLNLPCKKALLFAGGPVSSKTCHGFDHYFVESQINLDEFQQLGLPVSRAFGVNTQIMKPQKQPKVFDAYMPATCASWKRQSLFSKAVRDKGVLSGRDQETDPQPFIDARNNGTLLLPELPAEAVASLYNASHVCINTSEYWGGGQRATLESMACSVPVIAMSDSPKNREYVEESGFGITVPPNVEAIKGAIESIKKTPFPSSQGVDYIHSKYTEHHYAQAILDVITAI